MAKKQKNIIEKKWLIVKAKSKETDYDLKEIDELTSDLIAHLAQLTERGITEVDGVSIDLYKDRVWWVVEKVGLLPEYKDEEEEEEEIIDDWDSYEDYGDIDLEEEAHKAFYSENLQKMNQEELHCHYSNLPSPAAYQKDDIDYDGMGNQGRFPKVKKQTKMLTIRNFVNRIIVKFKLK